MPLFENILQEPPQVQPAVAFRSKHGLWQEAPHRADGSPHGELVAWGDETLIVDDRAGISPAQAVEDKLSRMLKDASLPVSHLQMRKLLRPR